MVLELIKRFGNKVEFDSDTNKARIVRRTLEDAIAEAKDGNLEPLRAIAEAKLPGITPFIQTPKRGHGKRRFTRDLDLEDAAEDVHYIRYELWKPVFGHYKRQDPPTAIQIAADFWKVDEGWLESRVDNRKRKNAGEDR